MSGFVDPLKTASCSGNHHHVVAFATTVRLSSADLCATTTESIVADNTRTRTSLIVYFHFQSRLYSTLNSSQDFRSPRQSSFRLSPPVFALTFDSHISPVATDTIRPSPALTTISLLVLRRSHYCFDFYHKYLDLSLSLSAFSILVLGMMYTTLFLKCEICTQFKPVLRL